MHFGKQNLVIPTTGCYNSGVRCDSQNHVSELRTLVSDTESPLQTHIRSHASNRYHNWACIEKERDSQFRDQLRERVPQFREQLDPLCRYKELMQYRKGIPVILVANKIDGSLCLLQVEPLGHHYSREVRGGGGSTPMTSV